MNKQVVSPQLVKAVFQFNNYIVKSNNVNTIRPRFVRTYC